MTIRRHEIRLFGRPVVATEYHGEFLLLRPASADARLPASFGARLSSRRPEFCDEVIATEREICLKLNDRYTEQGLQALNSIPADDAGAADGRAVRLPVRFGDSPDWDRVCRHTGLTREEYQTELLRCHLSVAMIGFLPGFVYLKGLPDRLQVPRKESPDRRAAANSFAVGGAYAGIYSLESPAGWNVLGEVGVNVLRLDQLPPVSLQPGDVVTLTERA
ncbi:carboxyltransferase domain-containing protein [Alienimonas californiensis]|uniref:Kinase A inhibitor n=1 Tax=Alienimonas californiensis TaxID=2527989 RepID=A0A517PB98_9PLAN|nr:carboxyltransferase domain-containing protein [Alienimonas californiensis]QDT16621.1 Kinase A inhibitor [Alienimonas californiensis]